MTNTSRHKQERIGRLLRMHANSREEIDAVYAGGIAAIIGLKDTFTGDTLAPREHPVVLEDITFPAPVISIAIEAKSKADQDKMGQALRKLSEEDPTFIATYNEETGQTIISGMGELHLEVIVDRMTREFRVGCNVGRPQVAYRETVRRTAEHETRFVRQTGGRGQFAHVILRIEPLPPGSENAFENSIRGGAIPQQYIPAVAKGVAQAQRNGVLGAHGVVDVRVTLVDGNYHEVDSSEMAFTTAASICFQEAMRRARPVLLEPIMKLEISTPERFLGDVVGDVSSRRGQVHGIEARGAVQLVSAMIPLAETFGYTTSLRSMTQGRATSSMEFDHYAEAPAAVAEAAAKA